MAIPSAPAAGSIADFYLGFPLVVIDFEATALTLTGYPIEVGIAKAASPGAEIEVWSSIIAPEPHWDIDRQWDPDAERIHGITRWQLRNASPARDVMEKLNDLGGPVGQVWCDGGHYDAFWLSVLAEAANIKPQFELCDLAAALNLKPETRKRYKNFIRGSAPPHRAGSDAKRICSALLAALASD